MNDNRTLHRPPDEHAAAGRAALEVGWIVCRPATTRLEQTAKDVLGRLRTHLDELAPGFAWQWRESTVAPAVPGNRTFEIMSLLESGIAVLDSDGLDFAFVLTDRAVSGSQGQTICAGSSSAAGVSVISIDAFPSLQGPALAERVCALATQLFGHMLGLETAGRDAAIIDESGNAEGQQGAGGFLPEEKPTLVAALTRAADTRVEERGMRAGIGFYAASARENRREILRSILRVRPWLMPFKLGRLTAAAASALFVLMMTAEVWELGMSQNAATLWGLSIVSLVGTAVFVLLRQRLLMASRSQRLSEQIAVMRIAITFGVFSGMLSTYLVLFVTCFAAAQLLFPAGVAARWSVSSDAALTWPAYVGFAAFVSALGVIIGALGASFERQGHLKQLAMLDKEI